MNSVVYRLICCRDVLIGVSSEMTSSVVGGVGDAWTEELAGECDAILSNALELLWTYFLHPIVDIAEETLSSIQALVKTMYVG